MAGGEDREITGAQLELSSSASTAHGKEGIPRQRSVLPCRLPGLRFNAGALRGYADEILLAFLAPILV